MSQVDLVSSGYSALKKSPFTPPDWVFGPVWGFLYTLIAISAVLYIRAGPTVQGLTAFGTQLFLNLTWPIIFFSQRRFCNALVNISLLVPLLVLTILEFKKRSLWASYLIIPYLIWVSFATYLNWYVCAMN
jgi:translocator protein